MINCKVLLHNIVVTNASELPALFILREVVPAAGRTCLRSFTATETASANRGRWLRSASSAATASLETRGEMSETTAYHFRTGPTST